MFKLCVLLAVLGLALAAPAPAPAPVPAPAPAPGLWGPWGPAPWGPAVVAAPHWAPAPHVVSVLPAAVSHAAITQVHPSPVLVKSAYPYGPVIVG
ncbi:neuropeptide-like 3 [Drosophila busckii]|uniref:neuropeptide-like 3 n=1 Tax=Drosophila busckii TaxID=30019 RepID=UPI00143298A1|nr:neuropeptide-like 3 [Drosophila busckii]